MCQNEKKKNWNSDECEQNSELFHHLFHIHLLYSSMFIRKFTIFNNKYHHFSGRLKNLNEIELWNRRYSQIIVKCCGIRQGNDELTKILF